MVDTSSMAIVCVLILVLLGLPLLAGGGRGSHCSGRASNTGMGGSPSSTASVASAVLLCCGSASNAGMGGRGLSH